MPARVDGAVKERLLKLVDDAVDAGWAHTRACAVLDVVDERVHHWRARLRDHGTLVDRAPGGNPVHRLLAWEEQAILDLIEDWGPIDRSHRKLAPPRLIYRPGVRVPVNGAAGERKTPGQPARRAATASPARPCPAAGALGEKPHLDVGRLPLPAGRRVAYAIIDVVTRYWIGYLLSSEQTTTQVQLLFARALEAQGLVDPASGLLVGRRSN